MPRARGIKQFLSPVEGLVTEQSPLSPKEQSSIDELNMEFSQDLSRRRRRPGINKEEGGEFIQLDTEPGSPFALTSFLWKNPAGERNLDLHVIQVGDAIYFFEDKEAPLSTGFKNFYLKLEEYANEAVTTPKDYSDNPVDFSSGAGFLVMVGKFIYPTLIEYDGESGTVSTSNIEIRIRDLEGLDDGLETSDRTNTLTDEHLYNLRNQTWAEDKRPKGSSVLSSPITEFFSKTATYPSNADIAFLGMTDDGTGDLRFDALFLQDQSLGNTPAPKGHFVIDPFEIDYNSLLTNTGTIGRSRLIGGAFPPSGGGGGTPPPPGWIGPTPPGFPDLIE